MTKRTTPRRAKLLLPAWASALLDLFYPPHCAFCRAATRSAREIICDECMKSAARILPPAACTICSAPGGAVNLAPARVATQAQGESMADEWDNWDNWESETPAGESEGEGDAPAFSSSPAPPAPPPSAAPLAHVCFACRRKRPLYDSAIVPYRSRAVVRETIHRFKYDGQLHFLPTLGDWLALVASDVRLKTAYPDAIVPVPLHPTRYRERGFNQAALLAAELGQRLGVPMLNALRRTVYTPSQTQLAKDERMENLRNAFEMRQSVDVQNLNLLLVDDVLTTGSTVNACAFTLKNAGATAVRVVAIARG